MEEAEGFTPAATIVRGEPMCKRSVSDYSDNCALNVVGRKAEAKCLIRNIKNRDHASTANLFKDTPRLSHHQWANWRGRQGYNRTALSIAVCHDDAWLVKFLVENTDCDTAFTEVKYHAS